MKTMQRFAVSAVTAAVLLGLGGCGEMTTRQRDTAIGAGVGAVGGNVLTSGSAAPVDYIDGFLDRMKTASK